jgi:hypothetical protein
MVHGKVSGGMPWILAVIWPDHFPTIESVVFLTSGGEGCWRGLAWTLRGTVRATKRAEAARHIKVLWAAGLSIVILNELSSGKKVMVVQENAQRRKG